MFFYELAIRHASAKPYIQLIDSSENIPFDIQDLNTIQYDFDVSIASKAVEDLQEVLEIIEESDIEFETPISRAAEVKSLRESEDPIQQNLADILGEVSALNKRIDNMEKLIKGGTQDYLWKSSGSIPTDKLSGYEVAIPEIKMDDLERGSLKIDPEAYDFIDRGRITVDPKKVKEVLEHRSVRGEPDTSESEDESEE